jgi:hypothetical protein
MPRTLAMPVHAHDEDERARYASYALYRRASEATTLRSTSNALPELST